MTITPTNNDWQKSRQVEAGNQIDLHTKAKVDTTRQRAYLLDECWFRFSFAAEKRSSGQRREWKHRPLFRHPENEFKSYSGKVANVKIQFRAL